MSIHDIEETAQVPVLSVLPEDINVLEAVAKAVPVTLHKSKSNASIEYKKLASFLINEKYEEPRLLYRLWLNAKSIFKKGIGKVETNKLSKGKQGILLPQLTSECRKSSFSAGI